MLQNVEQISNLIEGCNVEVGPCNAVMQSEHPPVNDYLIVMAL